MKKTSILVALLLCAALAGCGQSAPPQDSGTPQEPSGAVSAPPAEESTEPSLPADESTAPTPAEGEQTATLYIGTKAGGFTEYPMAYEGELTPELLIQGIADLTGWDLTLGEEVTSGKGAMSVCLADSSALFQGPPDPQKEEFHVFSAEELAEKILDSIQKTLQKNFVLEPGDPDNLDIWYYMENGEGLTLPDLGLSWPLDEPYQWANVQRQE